MAGRAPDDHAVTDWPTDAPRYSRGLIIAAGCTIAAAVVILIWKILYRLFDHGDGGVETTLGVSPSRERGEDVA